MLYEELLKLAHLQPELRHYLVPLLRTAEQDAKPSRWDDFLKERYDGGKRKVPNPNPKTRERFPQVTLSTAIKYPPALKKVQEEYEAWASKDKAPVPSKSAPKPKLEKGTQFKLDKDTAGFRYVDGTSATLPGGDEYEITDTKMTTIYPPRPTQAVVRSVSTGKKFRVEKKSIGHLFEEAAAPKAAVDAAFLPAKESAWKEFGDECDNSELSSYHKESLHNYSSDMYEKLNQSLRKRTNALAMSYMDYAVRDTLSGLDEAFESEAASVPRALKVLRSVDMNHPLAKMAKKGELEPGYIYQDDGFISTSIRPNWKWGGEMFLEISVPKGAKGIYIGPTNSHKGLSGHPDEYELLLNRGAKFKVLEIGHERIKIEMLEKE